jgi:mannose-6-phosphate isomerase-like protein (cupin superfamily)
MTPTPINLSHKLSLFTDQWSPKTIAQIDDYQFKLAKLQGDFVWHSHPETDEVFLVLNGRLRIDFRDGNVLLNAGEMLVVPKGVEHKPFADSQCHVMILVREGTVNTGDAAESERTADPDARI